MNFCATKFISFVALEQLNRPIPSPPLRSVAARSPVEARSRASSQVATRNAPLSRTIGSVSRVSPFGIEARSFPPVLPDPIDSKTGGDGVDTRPHGGQPLRR